MFQIPIYDDLNGKRMQQKSSYWWVNVLNNKCVPISKALDVQSRLSLRWSLTLDIKYHDRLILVNRPQLRP